MASTGRFLSDDLKLVCASFSGHFLPPPLPFPVHSVRSYPGASNLLEAFSFVISHRMTTDAHDENKSEDEVP